MISRRLFLHRLVRWGTVFLLAGITILLRKKIVSTKACSTCPEYASCSGVDSCLTELASK